MGSEEADFHKAGMQIEAFQDALTQLTRIIGSCSNEDRNSDRRVSMIRSEIFRNIQVYRALQFKAAVAFITSLYQVLSHFTDFSPQEFANSIHIVAQRAADYADQAQLVRDLHLLFYSDTRNLVERAERTGKQVSLEAAKHESAAKYLASKARRHKEKATNGEAVAGLTFGGAVLLAVPTMGFSLLGLVAVAAAGMYVDHHRSKQRRAFSDRDERFEDAVDARRAADELMAGPVSSCAETFSGAICVATTFFSNVNNQLQSFKQRAERARSYAEREELNRSLRFYCTKMRRPAANLKSLCEDFLRVAPSIDAKVSRICGGSDNSYVHNWLKNHEKDLGYWRVRTALRLIGT